MVFFSSRSTGNSRRAIEVLLYQLVLLGIEKDRPGLPRIIHRKRKLLYVLHYPEAAQCVRVLEWIGTWSDWFRCGRPDAGRQVQERFCSFRRQVPAISSRMSSVAFRTSGTHSGGTPYVRSVPSEMLWRARGSGESCTVSTYFGMVIS